MIKIKLEIKYIFAGICLLLFNTAYVTADIVLATEGTNVSQKNNQTSSTLGFPHRLGTRKDTIGESNKSNSKVGSVPISDSSGKYTQLKEKWKKQLVPDNYDPENHTLVNYVQTLSKEAIGLYQTMDKQATRTYLWPKKKEDTDSADLTTQFTNLEKIALAYGTKGTTLYRNMEVRTAIIDGLDFMITKKGYNGKKYYGNWWDWQIGIPKQLINILIVLDNDVPNEKLQQYVSAISGYVPDPFKQLYAKAQGIFVDLDFIPNFVTSGSNRTDLALITLGIGILDKNDSKITQASNSIVDVFKLVTRGDGFYKDGSFIQHNNIPYTGSYGNVLIKGVGQILAITQGTSFSMDPKIVTDFVKIVDQGFIPLIYKGEMLPTVMGRSISRAPAKTKIGYGSTTIYNLLIVSKFAPTDYKNKFQEAAKYWIKENPSYYLTNPRDFNDLEMTMNILSDTSVPGDGLPFIGTKMYASMDRFVQRTTDYMLGLSLYSSRTSSFEAGNKENKHGWHTSDGMIYLYNDDEVQFSSSYWPTVNPYELPGTTVDTVHLEDEVSAFTSVTSKENFVGGVNLEDQAVVGMSLNKEGTKNNGKMLPMNLHAKKSWFIVNDQIIALGAGIEGTTDASIETIVDNRLLNDNYTYQVLSDKGQIKKQKETSVKNWLLLQSNHQNASIGYYFPEKTQVDVKNEVRTGSYAQINEAFPSDKIYKGNYWKFIINHGKNPANASYAYVILPGSNETKIKAYAEKNPLKILANTDEIQAVKLPNKNYLGMNIWKKTGGGICGITSNKEVSLMMKTEGNKKTYVFSDPTQKNQTMTLKIPKDYNKIMSMSEGVTYDKANDTFTVNFENTNGSSRKIIVA